MSTIYFTIAGTNHYYGTKFMEPGMDVSLEKDPTNEYDTEAIKVTMPGMGKIGYVANSPYTIIGESYSAGRMYDKIGKTAKGKIKYVLPGGALCEVVEEPGEVDAEDEDAAVPYHRL